MLLRYFLILVVLSSCVCTGTLTSRKELLDREIEKYPSFFYKHYHSKDILTFEDSSLFIRSKGKPPGGELRVSNKRLVSNWSFSNDTIIELSNFSTDENSRLRNIDRCYYLDKSLKWIDLLVPDNSLGAYQDSLKSELIKKIRDNPFVADKDTQQLMKTDSLAVSKLTVYHYESIISRFTMDYYELGFYFGKWE